MTDTTSNLIVNLRKANSKEEALRMIVNKQVEIKSFLQSKGIKFYSEDYYDSQGVEAGQKIRDVDYPYYKAYDEVNFIRHGLTTGWYDRLGDQERFHKIQDDVTDIIDNLS